MFTAEIDTTLSKGALYRDLAASLESLLTGETDALANLANASALLAQALERINWCGFYLLRGEELVLGPFQGKPACVRIPVGKGVCGTAAARRETARRARRQRLSRPHRLRRGVALGDRRPDPRRTASCAASSTWTRRSSRRFDEADRAGLERFVASARSLEWRPSDARDLRTSALTAQPDEQIAKETVMED